MKKMLHLELFESFDGDRWHWRIVETTIGAGADNLTVKKGSAPSFDQAAKAAEAAYRAAVKGANAKAVGP